MRLRTFAALAAGTLLTLAGCQVAPTPEDQGRMVRTRVVAGDTRAVLDGVRASYRAPTSDAFVPIELLGNASGHWGEVPATGGVVRFERAGYRPEERPVESMPDEVPLAPRRE
jgi:hypothetical protein